MTVRRSHSDVLPGLSPIATPIRGIYSTVGRRQRQSKLVVCLIGLSLCHAAWPQSGDMTISHNKTFHLASMNLVLEEVPEGPRDSIGKVIRTEPFLELHISPPMPRAAFQRRMVHIFCEESGTYVARNGQTWTIGKRCRVLR